MVDIDEDLQAAGASLVGQIDPLGADALETCTVDRLGDDQLAALLLERAPLSAKSEHLGRNVVDDQVDLGALRVGDADVIEHVAHPPVDVVARLLGRWVAVTPVMMAPPPAFFARLAGTQSFVKLDARLAGSGVQ